MTRRGSTSGTTKFHASNANQRSDLSPKQRMRRDHRLRAIPGMTNQILESLSPRFTKMYSGAIHSTGLRRASPARPSCPVTAR